MSRYDKRAALVVVDLQNDFADPAGSLSVAGGDEIVPRVNEAARRAAEAGALVVATQDWHPASTPHFAKDGGIWPGHGSSDAAEQGAAAAHLGPAVREGCPGLGR